MKNHIRRGLKTYVYREFNGQLNSHIGMLKKIIFRLTIAGIIVLLNSCNSVIEPTVKVPRVVSNKAKLYAKFSKSRRNCGKTSPSELAYLLTNKQPDFDESYRYSLPKVRISYFEAYARELSVGFNKSDIECFIDNGDQMALIIEGYRTFTPLSPYALNSNPNVRSNYNITKNAIEYDAKIERFIEDNLINKVTVCSDTKEPGYFDCPSISSELWYLKSKIELFIDCKSGNFDRPLRSLKLAKKIGNMNVYQQIDFIDKRVDVGMLEGCKL